MPVPKNNKFPHLIDFPAKPENEGRREVQHMPHAQQKRSFRYLWLYVSGIFSVAIVLMLLSFMSQSRRTEQRHLDFSIFALNSIDLMKEENDSLKRENSDLLITQNALLGQIGDLQQQLDTLLQSNDSLRDKLAGADESLAALSAQFEELKEQLAQNQDDN